MAKTRVVTGKAGSGPPSGAKSPSPATNMPSHAESTNREFGAMIETRIANEHAKILGQYRDAVRNVMGEMLGAVGGAASRPDEGGMVIRESPGGDTDVLLDPEATGIGGGYSYRGKPPKGVK